MSEQLLKTIEAAMAEEADDATKERGAEACRTLLAALDTKPGQPLRLVPPPPAEMSEPAKPAPPVPPPASPLATLAQGFANVPTTTVLDALIAKLKSALPDEAKTGHDEQPVHRLNIPFVSLPSAGKGG